MRRNDVSDAFHEFEEMPEEFGTQKSRALVSHPSAVEVAEKLNRSHDRCLEMTLSQSSSQKTQVLVLCCLVLNDLSL